MSYQIGLDAVHLRRGPRMAHTEYCSNDALKRHLGVGRSAFAGARGQPTHAATFEDLWDIDLVWATDDGPVPWSARGRTTDMGHADFLEGGVDRREPAPSPFADADEVLAFDAVAEYGLPDADELTRYYQRTWTQRQRDFPNQVYTAGYYKTMVSGAIAAFGWDLLLEAAASLDRFERVLDSFFRLTQHHVAAWCRTDAPVFIQHDDFVWSSGPFMRPDFYRRAITPRYAELWKMLHDAGKKVLFCSDANWIDLLDDIAAAGADGFIFEPMMPLEPVVERYGQSHLIVSSKVDCRTLTFGSPPAIAAEIDASLALARRCRAFMFAVGNHIPSNVTVDNAVFYFNYLRERWHYD